MSVAKTADGHWKWLIAKTVIDKCIERATAPDYQGDITPHFSKREQPKLEKNPPMMIFRTNPIFRVKNQLKINLVLKINFEVSKNFWISLKFVTLFF